MMAQSDDAHSHTAGSVGTAVVHLFVEDNLFSNGSSLAPILGRP